jgi:hypothetical protein
MTILISLEYWFAEDFKQKGPQMIIQMIETTRSTIKILIKKGFFPKSSEVKLFEFLKGASARKEATGNNIYCPDFISFYFCLFNFISYFTILNKTFNL